MIKITHGDNVAVGTTPYADIELLKAELASTDYKAIKYAEGIIPETDYLPIKAERQRIRERIRQLEAELQ